ncbi:hypothetical protein JMA_41680 (plasmid) [Jeotgalibacillus malaysiensis]|uniref:Nucleoside 2-deoxyribosyltransferase n=1 Tax=Jeotgalibacillus malaysiensis TaxID=1508404 RepID=A0A0B5ATD9_9BACL|nr:hypothetical protein [Jeotgalibacillus malaysiensis]AJD93485.1 hypothetical protein JMA_41680 [Jeotgalibacillus malaysiensis]
MNIYVGHSKQMNYKEELYPVLKKIGDEMGVRFILPHDESLELYPSKEVLPTCDYMLADISLPALGLGIEIGWANMMDIPVFFIHKSDSELSHSVKAVSQNIRQYDSIDDLESVVREWVLNSL